MTSALTDRDREAVESFSNFLSWGEKPIPKGWHLGHKPYRFDWPPAVFAHVMGLTAYCPPKGTL